MKIGVNSVWKKTYFFLIFDITYGDHRDRDHIVVEFISICAVTAKAVTRCSQYLSLVTWYLTRDEVYSVVVYCDVVSRPWRGVLSGCLLWRGISPVTRCTQWLSCDVVSRPWRDVLRGCLLCRGISPLTMCTQWLSPVMCNLARGEVYSLVVSCDVVSRPWGCVLSSCLLWRGISSLTWCTQWLSLVAWNLARDDAYSAVVLWCGISPLNFFFLLLEKKNYLLNFIDIKSSDIYKICYMRHQIIITNTKYY
jgi:hypothetical protein